jgi:SMODS-associated and fused to various effectors sensor domain
MPILRNLGTTHAEVTKTTYGRLRYDFRARWTGQIAPAGKGPLHRELSARYAADALRAALPDSEGPADGCWQLMLGTRGDRPAPWPLTVDATALLGGGVPRPGDMETWQRLFAALCDLKTTLTAHGTRRDVEICTACHLTAAVAAGYVFRCPTGWRVGAIASDGTVCRRSPSIVDDDLEFVTELNAYTAAGGVLAVDIDLVPRHIENAVVRALREPPRARLSVRRRDTAAHMNPKEFGAIAGAIAARVKQMRGEVRATRIDLFVAAPGPLALLLGTEFGAVGCPVRLHEHHDDEYLPSLDLPG